MLSPTKKEAAAPNKVCEDQYSKVIETIELTNHPDTWPSVMSRNVRHYLAQRDPPTIMGVGRIFSRGAKCGEIWILPLEIEKTTFFCLLFQNPGWGLATPLSTPMPTITIEVLPETRVMGHGFLSSTAKKYCTAKR